MFEGIFVFIMSSIYSIIFQNPFKIIINYYNTNEIGNFVLLIFTLFLYFIFSGGLNIYKIYCNVIYSPMARSLNDYFFNPFFNIYYLIEENDFNKNFIYFILNEIICIIMDFLGCVFNEFIVLFFCSLDYDTKYGISKRAENIEMTNIISRISLNDEVRETINDDE